MSDILIFSSLIAGWIVLNLWVLPLFGIETCLSGACRETPAREDVPPATADRRAGAIGAARD